MGALNALFDTNILIDYLRKLPEAARELDRYKLVNRSISVVSWIEVMAGVRPANEEVTRRFLKQFELLPVSDTVAERSAILRRERRINLPDAIIWATAEISGRLLVTRNTRDYPGDDPAVRIPYVVSTSSIR
jgi:predicted nucleic acid-binding protein